MNVLKVEKKKNFVKAVTCNWELQTDLIPKSQRLSAGHLDQKMADTRH